MGAGKTTIGRRLAKRLSIDFYDSDHEIEQRTGADIALIFAIEGETGFRKREAQVISELTMLNNIVLATGGGAVVQPENRENLKRSGLVIYLKSKPERLCNRIANDKRRPLLQGDDRLQRIRTILNERESLYTALADEIVDIDAMTVRQIIRTIIKLIDEA